MIKNNYFNSQLFLSAYLSLYTLHSKISSHDFKNKGIVRIPIEVYNILMLFCIYVLENLRSLDFETQDVKSVISD